MKRALFLAKKGGGSVFPNPKVGAIVVKEGKILGEGYHHEFGQPHAEIIALDAAGVAASGANLYVTLEPCNHYGKTPPCTERIIQSKIQKVYIALRDPNPVVNGKGIATLKKNGVQVLSGILRDKAEQLNADYLHYIHYKRPLVIAKWAMTIDGKIATRAGDSKWISSKSARHFVHRIRNAVGAIIVGANTVLCDDPVLTVRGIKNRNKPWRIVLDRTFTVSSQARIFGKEARTILVTNFANHHKEKTQQLLQKDVAIWFVRSNKELLEKLAQAGIAKVLIEGGGTVHAQFLENGLVDKVIAFIAPKIIGGKNAPTPVEGAGVQKIGDACRLKNIRLAQFGDTLAMEGDITKHGYQSFLSPQFLLQSTSKVV